MTTPGERGRGGSGCGSGLPAVSLWRRQPIAARAQDNERPAVSRKRFVALDNMTSYQSVQIRSVQIQFVQIYNRYKYHRYKLQSVQITIGTNYNRYNLRSIQVTIGTNQNRYKMKHMPKPKPLLPALGCRAPGIQIINSLPDQIPKNLLRELNTNL